MGDGCAEEGQDGVAHQPGHRAFVLVDRLDHVLEGAVDDLGPLLRVELVGGGGGAFDIAEEHGDDAAFAHHGATGAGAAQLAHQLFGDEAIQVGGRLSCGSRLQAGREQNWGRAQVQGRAQRPSGGRS